MEFGKLQLICFFANNNTEKYVLIPFPKGTVPFIYSRYSNKCFVDVDEKLWHYKPMLINNNFYDPEFLSNVFHCYRFSSNPDIGSQNR